METLVLAKELGIGMITILLVVIGFFLKGLANRINGIDEKVADLPKEYVLKTDHKEEIRDLKERFDKMENHLVRIEDGMKQLLKGAR